MKIKEITNPSLSSSALASVVLSSVQAGFPSPADDFVEKELDLNALVVKKPAATFYVKVEGESMINAGICSGDLLVVDRSLEPKSGQIVVAVVNGEFTVKRLEVSVKGCFLVPENSKYPVLRVDGENECQIWGVVTYVIHKTR